jgi:hypothetical protein
VTQVEDRQDAPKSIPAMPLMIGGLANDTDDEGQGGGMKRIRLPFTLSFPADRMVGTVMLTAPGGEKGDMLPAQGDIAVGANYGVQLNLDATLTDLDFIDAIPEGAVQALYAVGLGDALLDKVARFTRMRFLTVSGVTDAGIAKLAGIQTLRTLAINSLEITDAAVPSFAAIPNLKALSLGVSSITDEGVRALAGIERLISLTLGSDHLTDAALTACQDMPNLDTLRFMKASGLTDAGLLVLAEGFPALKQFQVRNAPITERGVLLAFAAGAKASINNNWYSPKAVSRLLG